MSITDKVKRNMRANSEPQASEDKERNKCPHGHKFAEEWSEFDICLGGCKIEDECEETWVKRFG